MHYEIANIIVEKVAW